MTGTFTTRNRPSADVDVIVVGAGSAGGVLAARLAEDPACSVLLLEAGPDFGPFVADLPPKVRDAEDASATPYDWGHTGDATRLGRRVPLYAGKLLGGSSATNNVMALRGHPAGYDAWARAGCRGWSFEALLPAFKRAERDLDFDDQWHGRDGPVPVRRHPPAALRPVQRAFLDACAAAGHETVEDHNAPGALGAGPLPVNELGGVRQSVALTYLAAARQRPNLTIRPRTHVEQVLIENGRAVGELDADGARLRGRRVVLSAGALGSPRILLRSGIGPAEHLRALGIPTRHHLPGVGRNLHDHSLLRLQFTTDQAPVPPARQTLLTAHTGIGDDPQPDLQVFPNGPVPHERGATLTLLVALMTPNSRGELHLRTPDPAAAPHIDPGYLRDPHDLSRLVAGVRHARAIAAIPPLREQLGRELWPGAHLREDSLLQRAVLEEVMPYHHPVGSCRMGPADDPEAVVDHRGRVHGIHNLWVVDASIMPSIPSANTNLPTLGIAEHLRNLP